MAQPSSEAIKDGCIAPAARFEDDEETEPNERPPMARLTLIQGGKG